MAPWNDPFVLSAAELCWVIRDHRFTPLLALYAASNGQKDVATTESAIKAVEAILLQRKERLAKPDMSEKTLLECCYIIHKHAKRLPNMKKLATLSAAKFEDFRTTKQPDVMLIAGCRIDDTRSAGQLYASIRRHIKKRQDDNDKNNNRQDDTATEVVPPPVLRVITVDSDDDDDLLGVMVGSSGTPLSNARSSISSSTDKL